MVQSAVSDFYSSPGAVEGWSSVTELPAGDERLWYNPQFLTSIAALGLRKVGAPSLSYRQETRDCGTIRSF